MPLKVSASTTERRQASNPAPIISWRSTGGTATACRSDTDLSGLLLGLTTETTGVGIYRALIESLCFGARTVVDLFEAGDFAINRVILTSGLAQNNPLLVQIMADVLGRVVEVPGIAHATAVGAAVHGAVAAELVGGFAEGTARFGARTFTPYHPRRESAAAYRYLYKNYRELGDSQAVRNAMHDLNRAAAVPRQHGEAAKSVA